MSRAVPAWPSFLDIDTNKDGVVDFLDIVPFIDLLTVLPAARQPRSVRPRCGHIFIDTFLSIFDINGDGAVNEPDGRNTIQEILANPALEGDMDYLIHVCFNTEYGDINLDGRISQADLDIILLNFGRQGAGWADGDVSGDGIVSQADLDSVLLNFGFVAN